ncbi:hypothetical protein AB6A40_006867 [Gnathostoma spinigerum]|uniref:RPA-interacting protein C-terminal domain-containing protein n=1 Tax=Gnathostoma spinigerum TaxID=75299 RepID=A0ABD6ET00_9BILA
MFSIGVVAKPELSCTISREMNNTGMEGCSSGGSAVSKRAVQYKPKGKDWKVTLRENCMRNLREQRQKSFNTARGISVTHCFKNRLIDNIIAEELRALHCDEGFPPFEIDREIEDFEDLKKELLQQELEDMLAFEEQRIADDVNSYLKEEVVCPSCQKSALLYSDQTTVTCPSCSFTFHFLHAVPPPQKLTEYFLSLFSQHDNVSCTQTPHLEAADNQVKLACSACGFCSTY